MKKVHKTCPIFTTVAMAMANQHPSVTKVVQADTSSNRDSEEADQVQHQMSALMMEVAQYKEEIRILQGKIRGYQTLGHLLSEAKEEVAKYKKMNKELMSKLDVYSSQEGGSSRASLESAKISLAEAEKSQDTTAAEGGNNVGRPQFTYTSLNHGAHLNMTTGFQSPESSITAANNIRLQWDSKRMDDTLEKAPLEFFPEAANEQVQNQFEKLASQTGECNTGDEDEVKLISFSSVPSTLITASSSRQDRSCADQDKGLAGPLSAAALASASAGGGGGQWSSTALTSLVGHATLPPSHPQSSLSTTSQGADSMSELVEPSEVSIRVMDISHRLSQYIGLDSSSELAPDLIKVAIEVMKMEKFCKAKQDLADVLGEQNSSLKTELRRLQQEIKVLRETNDKLRNQLQKLERERDKMSPLESLHDDENTQWVRIEKLQKGEEDMKMIEGTMSESERQTKNKFQRLTLRLQKVLEEKEDTEKEFSEHQQQSEMRINELQRALQEVKMQQRQKMQEEDKRQREIDSVLLTAKKRVEDHEMAKEEALQELHLQKRRQERLEHKASREHTRADELQQRVESLEREVERMRDLAAVQRRSPSRLDIAGATESMAAMSMQEMATELQVLREQVKIYKDDFENERRDRERAQAEKDCVTTDINNLKDDLMRSRDQTRQRELDVIQLREQGRKMGDELENRKLEMRRLQDTIQSMRQAYPNFPMVYPQQMPSEAYNPTFPQQIGVYPGSSGPSWACNKCTYENPAERSTCELCGAPHRGLDTSSRPLQGLSRHHRYTSRDIEQCDDPSQTSGSNHFPVYGMSSRPDREDTMIDSTT